MHSPDVVFDSPLPSAPLAEFRNFTPFPSQYYQTVDVADNVFHAAVLRVTYSLRRSQKDGSLTFADEQTPLATSDANYGEVNVSSLKWESDLAPYKPKCDILLVNAVAHSPGGKAQARWPVTLEVGNWQKTLMVTGPRHFKRNRKGEYLLTEPEPATTVPLIYEYAHGGQNIYPESSAKDEAPALWQLDMRNPVGRGFRHEDWLKRAKPEIIPAPQIELPDQPYRGEADYPVCGFGALAKPWQPRLPLAGTYDDEWKQTRWPRLPEDHDYAYWNCAPADQQIDFPLGGETIVLHNLHARSRVQFKLPVHQWFCMVRLNAGPMLTKPLMLDTLIVNFEAFQLISVYRCLIAAEAGVRVIEARLAQFDA